MKFLDIFITIPEFFFVNVISVFLWLGLYLRYKNASHLWVKTFGYYSILVLVLYSFILINTPFEVGFAFNGVYNVTGGELFFKFLIQIVSILIFFISVDTEKNYKICDATLEIWFVRLLIVVSLSFIVSSNDLILIFFALELYALSSYILVGYKGKFSVFSSESAIKYFILGAIFSIIFVYGISLLYMLTGLTNISDICMFFNFTSFLSTSKFVYSYKLAIVFLVSGILFKVAAAPFHFWSPDVYDGAPTSIVLFLSTVPKVALFALLMKLSFLVEIFELSQLFFVAGVLSILMGSIGGLFQKRIKRLLAYSMINNTGFLVLAISIISITSASFVVFFLLSYLLTLVGLFAVVLTLRIVNTSFLIKNLYGLSNLFFVNKSLSIGLTMLLFSSAGLPPLVGFLSKFFVLLTLADLSSQLFYILLLVLVFAPLSAFYYVRVLKIMSFSKRRFWIFFYPVGFSSSYVISLVLFLTLLMFWISGFLLTFSTFFIS